MANSGPVCLGHNYKHDNMYLIIINNLNLFGESKLVAYQSHQFCILSVLYNLGKPEIT